jgi:hypothetical protein
LGISASLYALHITASKKDDRSVKNIPASLHLLGHIGQPLCNTHHDIPDDRSVKNIPASLHLLGHIGQPLCTKHHDIPDDRSVKYIPASLHSKKAQPLKWMLKKHLF